MTNNMFNQEVSYYSEIQPEIITLKSDKRYYVQGYISTTAMDLANDVLTMDAQKDLYNQIMSAIAKGGFITGDIEHMVFYDEFGKELAFPKVRDEKGNMIIPEIKFIDARLTDKGVWAKAEVNKYHPNFNSIWKSIEEGYLNGFSVAVRAVESITQKINGVMVDLISKIKLINVTMTGTPCNPEALMQPVLKSLIKSTKNMNGDIMKYEELSEEQKKKYDELESEDDKKNYLESCGTKKKSEEDSNVSEDNTNPDDVSLKSEIPSLKSEISVLKSDNTSLKSELALLKSELEAKSTELNNLLKSELSTLGERITKIENQPIKKSLMADKSVMLGVSQDVKLENKSVFDLI